MLHILALLAIVAALFFYALFKLRQWRNRPRRLCLACGSISYPSRDEHWNYHCPFCLSQDPPISLNDPAAIAYLADQQTPQV